MISKKSRKVVAALLIGATVCASGTFAYFNSKLDMSKIANGASMQKLDITNGYINIEGELTGDALVKASGWTYDVATISSGATAADRSPDIVGFSTKDDADNYEWTTEDTAENKTVKRVTIGSPLKGKISKARPGDAVVLGDAANGSGGGITIKNHSNLTCKAKVAFSDEVSRGAEAALEAMGNAGWVMYINDVEVSLKPQTTNIGGVQTTKTAVDFVNEQLKNIETSIASKTDVTLKIRFELPLLTNNQYQNQTNGGTDGTTAFDLSNILDIVVTQENNPGWGTDGTSDLPAVQTPDNNNGNDGTGFKGGQNEDVNADGSKVTP